MKNMKCCEYGPDFLDFDMIWLGSTAAERESAFFHISLADHPASVLVSEL
jgi:hypothetical protein